MLHRHIPSAASLLFGLSVVWTTVAQTALPKPESPLLQSEHIVGDTVDGFRKTCLTVYPDGEYHREQHRQVSRNGRPQFEWEAPEVSEASLSRDDLDALFTILGTPEFSAIKGAVGDSRSLLSKLVFGPQGAVIPHENIEIVTAAIARSNGMQVFELADVDVARRQEPLRAFLNWINGTERSQAQRSTASQANNCSALIVSVGGGASVATGVTLPKALYAPDPLHPQIPKPQAVMVELSVDPDGTVAKASLQGHPNPEVAQSVLDAVKKWRFQPARLLGVPIAKTIRVRIELRSK